MAAYASCLFRIHCAWQESNSYKLRPNFWSNLREVKSKAQSQELAKVATKNHIQHNFEGNTEFEAGFYTK